MASVRVCFGDIAGKKVEKEALNRGLLLVYSEDLVRKAAPGRNMIEKHASEVIYSCRA